MFRLIVHRIADPFFLALLVAVSFTFLAVRSLFVRRRRSAPPPQSYGSNQFAFHSAIQAYEELIDSAAERRS